ncbi:collagen-like triple helix repeat-containing protein [Costertonia aggregata]|uniref:Collagen-like protein n=1 Tax=Costertonia aggregata TaxID=343403 RepID=A0A7H9ATC0_9FLAO|nr:collagen-like protein [Costertonia aggregata]QLG46445.1 collagen-like protein [Costertonia aggregata]
MKKAILVLGTFLTLFMVSCEGPVGPPGFDGRDGAPGLDGRDGEEATVFEVTEVNFEYLNDINSHVAAISFTALPSDAVLVYRFDGTTEINGNVENLWSLIPQSFFLPEGTIQYTYTHTPADVEILIDGNFDLSTLSADFTQDQIFRVVIIPGQFASSKSDKSNIVSVMNSLGLGEKDVKKITMP